MRKASKTGARAPLEIGWREWVQLPDLCDMPILAKIDTGAKSSAIHAYRVREGKRNGALVAEFFLHPLQKQNRPEIFCVAPVHGRRIVRSSNGAEQERFVILTRLRLGKKLKTIELTLANRDDMGFRLLIGRDALGKNVIIHPSRSYMLGRL
jgi:hypothetical protein